MIQKQKGVEEVDYYVVLKWAIMWYMVPYLKVYMLNACLSEVLAVFYAYFIGHMIEYIGDPDADKKWGFVYAAIFAVS